MCGVYNVPLLFFIKSELKRLFQDALQIYFFSLSICKHFAYVAVHGGMSGESCTEPVSTKQ